MNPDVARGERKGDTVVFSGGDTFPRPDPTRLTTEQLNRETSALRELFSIRVEEINLRIGLLFADMGNVPARVEKDIDHLRGFISTRLDGMDKAIVLLQEIFDHVPRQTDEKIMALRWLHEEKFLSIQTQFRERDVRTEQYSKDSKVAVDAALQAAKEAVGEQNKSSALAIGKSEASTTKQIDQLSTQIASQTKNFDDKVADIKDRLTRIEGGAVGQKESEGHHQSVARTGPGWRSRMRQGGRSQEFC